MGNTELSDNKKESFKVGELDKAKKGKRDGNGKKAAFKRFKATDEKYVKDVSCIEAQNKEVGVFWSETCGCWGLRFLRDFKAGDKIGQYNGDDVTDIVGGNRDYVLELMAQSGEKIQIDGTPRALGDPERLLSYGNEYVWSVDGNNFRFCSDGQGEVLSDVRRNTEVYIYYGEEYDWSAVKLKLIEKCCELARQIGALQEGAREWAEVLDNVIACPRSKQSTEIYDLFDAVVNNEYGEWNCSDLRILECDDMLSWLGKVCNHDAFLTQVVFRVAGEPGAQAQPSWESLLSATSSREHLRRNVTRCNMSEDNMARRGEALDIGLIRSPGHKALELHRPNGGAARHVTQAVSNPHGVDSMATGHGGVAAHSAQLGGQLLNVTNMPVYVHNTVIRSSTTAGAATAEQAGKERARHHLSADARPYVPTHIRGNRPLVRCRPKSDEGSAERSAESQNLRTDNNEPVDRLPMLQAGQLVWYWDKNNARFEARVKQADQHEGVYLIEYTDCSGNEHVVQTAADNIRVIRERERGKADRIRKKKEKQKMKRRAAIERTKASKQAKNLKTPWKAEAREVQLSDEAADRATVVTKVPGAHDKVGKLRCAFENVNGLTDLSLQLVIERISKDALDVTFLSDARATLQQSKAYKSQLKNKLPNHLLLCKGVVPAPGMERVCVGGQVVILSPVAARHLVDYSTDVSGLQLVDSIRLKFNQLDLKIMGTYWPIPHGKKEHPNSLWHRTRKVMKEKKLDYCSPMEYIHDWIKGVQFHHRQNPNAAVLIGGDLNAGMAQGDGGVHKGLVEWAQVNMVERVVPHPDTATYFSGGSNKTPTSKIDHIFEFGLRHSGTKVVYEPEREQMHSDHAMLITDVLLPAGTAKYIRPVVEKAPELSRMNKKKIRAFREDIGAHCEDKTTRNMSCQEAGEALEEIAKLSAKLCRSKDGGERRKDGWSPEFMVIRCKHDMMCEIRSSIEGSRHKFKWRTYSQFDIGVRIIVNKWQKIMDKYTVSDAFRIERDRDVTGPSFWRTCSLTQAKAVIYDAITRARKCLHGVYRTDMRRQISKAVAIRESARAEGKLKRVIASITDKQVVNAQFERVTLADGRIFTAADEVQKALTDFFEDWFSKPQGNTDALQSDETDWMELNDSETAFMAAAAGSNVPEDLVKLLWKSLANPSLQLDDETDGESLRSKFAAVCERTPSLAEFEGAIKRAMNDSAGGITGLTYNMVKQWPEHVIVYAYELLVIMWEEKHIPDHWKFKWLSPIPKIAGNSDLTNMRPITLVEVVRKLWASILVYKIKQFWHTNKLLNPSQHAYNKGMGTESASMLFIQALETAMATESDVFICSWDQRRAFDSVAKTILRLSWYRLGVPLDLANYLVDLDFQGRSVIKTPYAQRIIRKKGFDGTDKHIPSVCNQRGAAQGDVASSFSWNSFFDILLTALELDAKIDTSLWERGEENCELHQTRDPAYSDDLISITSTLKGLQRKADIVSAFAIIFGMQLVEQKLRAHFKTWRANDTAPKSIFIHTIGWQAVEIPLINGGEVKYLGCIHSIGKKNTTQIKKVQMMAKTICATINTKNATMQTKFKVLGMSTVRKLVYPAKFCEGTRAQWEVVDKEFLKLGKRGLGAQKTMASRILHMSKDQGIGLPNFANIVEEEKWSVLLRGIQRPCTKNAMYGIVGRAMDQGGSGWERGRGSTIPQGNNDQWISSLVKHAKSNGVQICITGPSSVGQASEPLHCFVPVDLIEPLKGTNVLTVGDLTTWNSQTQEYEWAPRLNEACDDITRHLKDIDYTWSNTTADGEAVLTSVPQTHSSWRVGQMFMHKEGSAEEEAIYEFLGFYDAHSGDAFLRQYRCRKYICEDCKTPSKKKGASRNSCRCNYWHAHSTLYEETDVDLNLGAGCRYIRLAQKLRCEGVYTQVISSNQGSWKGKRFFTLEAITTKPGFSVGLEKEATDWERATDTLLAHMSEEGSTLTSDGGWKDNSSLVDKLLMRDKDIAAAASLVCLNEKKKTAVSILLTDIESFHPDSAHTSELLGIAMSTDLRARAAKLNPEGETVHAASDCKSAMRVSNEFWRASARINSGLLGISSFVNRQMEELDAKFGAKCQVGWIQSHPEKRKKETRWSPEDRRIALADDVASGHHRLDINNQITETKIETFLDHIICSPGGIILTKDTKMVNGSLRSLALSNNTNDYLRERDLHRATRGRSKKWEGSTIKLAAVVWELDKKDIGQRCSATKHFLDRFLHNGSLAQYAKDRPDLTDSNDPSIISRAEVTEDCPLCGECDSQEHYARRCTRKEVVEARRIVLLQLGAIVNRTIKEEELPLVEFAIALDRMAMGMFVPRTLEETETGGYIPISLQYGEKIAESEEEEANTDKGTTCQRTEESQSASGHVQDAHYGFCLWTGIIDSHIEGRLKQLLEGEFFTRERNQQKAKKLFQSICKILTKATAAAWASRCKLWKDPNQNVKDTSIVRGQEATTTKISFKKRKLKGAGKNRYIDKRLCTQTHMSNFALEFPPVRQLTQQEKDEDARRKEREDLVSQAALEKKARAKAATKRSNARKAAGEQMRPKKKSKKALVAQPGDSKIKDHFNTDPTTITTQPETASKTTTKATTSTATITSKTKVTTTQITNFFQIKDMNKNKKNKFNNSNKNNVCNAHPPRKGMEVEVVTEDKMEIRQGIG